MSTTPPPLSTLLQNSYLKNFITLLPFLFLGSLILFLLNRAESLRVGAGLQPPQSIPQPTNPPQNDQPQPQTDTTDENPQRDQNDDRPQEQGQEEEEEVDVNEFLAEAGGIADGDFDPDFDADDNDDTGGPANPAAPRPPRNRGIVGKKKARNLEMRDRRRAYNEFIQSQARDRREREKALDDDLQEALYTEKQRRALAEIKIEKQKLLEKEAKREAEEKNQKYKLALRNAIDSIKGCGKVSLRALGHRVGKDEEWVKKNLNVGDISANADSEGVYSIVTESGWLVRIGKEEMAGLGKRLEGAGKMSWEDLSYELEDSLKRL
ncbi:hypothetical protein TWF694_008952 [Orbilia ellipsospora]|uniref:DDRGK domain-containing protein 1 n=1 Tax=Orbilia ellipsospora TaxID=2528407 RepID=A0AAV9XDF2_9PEZI